VTEPTDVEIERIARELAVWHGSAYDFLDRDGQPQTVASGRGYGRFAGASDKYAATNWKKYRGAARFVLEREASMMAEKNRMEIAGLLAIDALKACQANGHLSDAQRALVDAALAAMFDARERWRSDPEHMPD